MLRTMLLLALGPPATIDVRVDALALPHAQTEQLHGELMTRLVEAGHAVGATAAVAVRLTGGGDVVRVEVAHGSTIRGRDVRGQGAVLRLAVIHAAIELLAEIDAVRIDPDPALAAPVDRAVVIEIDDAAQAQVAPNMGTIVGAIVDAGWVVTPSADGASRRVCIGEQDGTPTVVVVAIDAPCEAGAAVVAWAPEVAAALRVPLAAPAPEPEPAEPAVEEVDPEPTTTTPTDRVPTAIAEPAAPRWSGVLGVAAGVQGRVRAPEALIVLHGDARHDSGLVLTTRVSTAPSVGRDLAAADTFVTFGVGYGRALGRRVRLEAALAGGVDVHAYRIGEDRGARVDPTLELPVTASIAIADRVGLVLAVQGGVSTRSREHRRGDDVVWSRDRWRVAGVLGIDVMLGRKRSGASAAGRP